jgi:hypothetical protein
VRSVILTQLLEHVRDASGLHVFRLPNEKYCSWRRVTSEEIVHRWLKQLNATKTQYGVGIQAEGVNLLLASSSAFTGFEKAISSSPVVTPTDPDRELEIWSHLIDAARKLGVLTFIDAVDLREEPKLAMLLAAQLFATCYRPTKRAARPSTTVLENIIEIEHYSSDVVEQTRASYNTFDRSEQFRFYYACDSTIHVEAVPNEVVVPAECPQALIPIEDDEFMSTSGPEASCVGVMSAILNMFSGSAVQMNKSVGNSSEKKNALKRNTEDITLMWGSYFDFKEPTDAAEGIGNAEYNLVKGVIGAPVLMAMAPLTAPFCVSSGSSANDSIAHEYPSDDDDAKTVTNVPPKALSLAKGLVRSVVGGPSLLVGGLVSASSQLYHGFVHGEPAPGTGETIAEKYQHLHDTDVFNLACNTEPDDFGDIVEDLITEGKLPKRDVQYSYQFFKSTEPANLLEGTRQAEFNMFKGVIVGGTLIISAPLRDAMDKFRDHGIIGSAIGLCGGVVRGTVGGVVLITAGSLHGIRQQIRGVITPKNYEASVAAFRSLSEDLHLLATQPLLKLLLPSNIDVISAVDDDDYE